MAFEEPITREEYVFLAKLAEQAERYDEMVGLMDKLVLEMPSLEELTAEERNLLSIAYKNLVGSHRDSWRMVSFIEKKEGRRNEEHAAIIKDYRARIEADIASVCGRILGLIESHLTPSACSRDSKIFFLKMKADYHRYLAEFKVGEELKKATEDAMAAYKEAQDITLADLAPTHPLRLGVALNFAVFYYEILNLTEEARRMAKEAFEDAVVEVDNLDEQSYKDCKVIMQTLQDNITLWTCNAQERIDDR